jgi:hypothetical protein
MTRSWTHDLSHTKGASLTITPHDQVLNTQREHTKHYITWPGLEPMIYHTKHYTIRPGIEPMIYHTRREQTNHYTTFCSLCCMSFIYLRLLNAPLVSFAHCVVCPSLIYGFWLHLWYLLPIVLSILHWFTASVCTFVGRRYQRCDQKRISMKDRQHNGQKIPKVQSQAVNQWRIYNTMNKRYQRCNQKPYINEG